MISKCKVCGGKGFTDPNDPFVGALLGGERKPCPSCDGAGEIEINIPKEETITCKFCTGRGVIMSNGYFGISSIASACPNCKGLGIMQRPQVGTKHVKASETESSSPIGSINIKRPAITSQVVDRALADAESLIKISGATSGVDRVHTALHGYLLEICARENITVKENASTTELFKRIREGHSKFKDMEPRSEDVMKILKSMGSIIDAMNPIRNRASVAHPNSKLLDEQEAMLVINVARTILHYIDSKLSK